MPTYSDTPGVLSSATTYVRTAYPTTTTSSVSVTPNGTRPYVVREYKREEPTSVRVIRASPSTTTFSTLSTSSPYETHTPAHTPARPGGLPGPNGDYAGELGRAAWLLLHASAEQYPANPTPQEQQTARNFVNSFAALYPCMKCRLHFQKLVHENPPDVGSQAAFVAWVIRLHNLVNVHLGKPTWA